MNSDNERTPIIVQGYPRSGNSWLSRLLGDVLDSPVLSPPLRLSLSEEGQNRPGKFAIYQMHTPNLDAYDPPARVVHIIRDPRDIAISAWHYWERPSLSDTLECMGEGRWPIPHGGGWTKYMENRLPLTGAGYPFDKTSRFTRYEWLSIDTYYEIYRLLTTLDIEPVKDPAKVIRRQSFAVRKRYAQMDGDKLPYGRDIQLKLMRKGIVDDWVNYFTLSLGEIAHGYFGETMMRLGYEHDEDWWKELPENISGENE